MLTCKLDSTSVKCFQIKTIRWIQPDSSASRDYRRVVRPHLSVDSRVVRSSEEVNSIVMVISRSVSKERENGDIRRSRSGEGRPVSRSRSRSRNRSHSPRGRRSYSPRRSRSRSRGRRFSRSRSRSRSRSNDDGYRLHIGGNFQKIKTVALSWPHLCRVS